MSNPGVIVLEDVISKNKKFKRFTIEDNIGEAIHLHIDDHRIDFSIDEFLKFSKIIRKSLIELNLLKGFSINEFDVNFLRDISIYLDDLIDIKIEKIKISKLKCIHRFKFFKNLYLTKLVNVNGTAVYKYLKGTCKSFINYPQYNQFNKNNIERLEELKKSIKKNYAKNNEYIILFNGQNIVRDGQHRVSLLADIYGLETKIDVMRFYFKGKKHIYKPFSNNVIRTLYWFIKIMYNNVFKVLLKLLKLKN